MIFCDPDVKSVFGKIGNITGESCSVMVHGLASQNPAHVRPPLAITRRMRIAIFIRMLMMNAVSGHPENRAALERRGGADRQKILHPLRSLVATMGQQAVVAHADAQASRNPPKEARHKKGLPGEKE